jgi:hypothetical protein
VHIEVIGKSPNEVNNKDTNKDIDGNCTLDQFVNVVEKDGDKEYIDKIDESEIPKF